MYCATLSPTSQLTSWELEIFSLRRLHRSSSSGESTFRYNLRFKETAGMRALTVGVSSTSRIRPSLKALACLHVRVSGCLGFTDRHRSQSVSTDEYVLFAGFVVPENECVPVNSYIQSLLSTSLSVVCLSTSSYLVVHLATVASFYVLYCTDRDQRVCKPEIHAPSIRDKANHCQLQLV